MYNLKPCHNVISDLGDLFGRFGFSGFGPGLLGVWVGRFSSPARLIKFPSLGSFSNKKMSLVTTHSSVMVIIKALRSFQLGKNEQLRQKHVGLFNGLSIF